MRAWYFAVVALGLGCGPPQRPQSGRGEQGLATPVPASSPLFVVAEGGEGTAEYDSFLRLCLIDRQAFLCGRGLVFAEGRFVPDPTELSERGMYRGFWNPPVGHLPDEVYIVDDDRTRGNEQALNPLGVYRFEQRRWHHLGTLGDGTEHRIGSVSLSAWTAGRAIVVDSRLVHGESRSELKTVGRGQGPSLPQPTPPRDERAEQLVRAKSGWLVHGFADGAVALSHGNMVEVWADTGKPSQLIDVTASGCTVFNWHVAGPWDIMLFGVGRTRPCGVHVTLGGFSERTDLEILGEEIASYARAPGGAEWVVAGRALWQRPAAGTWQRVTLPPAAFSKAKNVQLEPLEVWAPSDDETWVYAHYEEESGRDFGVVLHNRAPASVCFVRERGCEPAP